MGTSQAARAPTTRKWKNVPASLRNPNRNPATVTNAVLAATGPALMTAGVATNPFFYAAYQGIRFAIDVRQHGLEVAARNTAIRVVDEYVGPSIARGLWDAASSHVDPEIANSPFGKLAETAFKKTMSSVISKGIDAMVEE